MKRKFYYSCLVSALLLAACSSDVEIPVTGETPADGIRFDTSVVSGGADTRAVLSGTQFPVGGTFPIGIYMTNPGATTAYQHGWSTGDVAGQYRNVYVSLKVTGTTLAPVYTWSGYGNSNREALVPAGRMVFEVGGTPTDVKADFYAYYPQQAKTTVPSLDAVPFDLINQDDVLFSYHKGYSKAQMHTGTDPVTFKFFHAMSLIAVQVKNTGLLPIKVEGAQVSNDAGSDAHVSTTGKLNLAAAVIAGDELSATCPVIADAPAANAAIKNVLTTAISLNPAQEASTNQLIYLLIPPTASPAATDVQRIKLILTVDGYPTSSCLLPLPLISGGSNDGKYGFEQGKMHTYKININASAISFESLSIGQWTAGAGSTIII